MVHGFRADNGIVVKDANFYERYEAGEY
jgi:hypothetical protein